MSLGFNRHNEGGDEISNKAYSCAHYCQNEYQTKNCSVNFKILSKTAANTKEFFVGS
jgi:hypothetical protein